MALLGESFNSYVRNQINVRQDKLSLDQNRNDDVLKYFTSKTSFLRLTSGVNVSPERSKKGGLGNLEGNLLAKKYVLFSSRFNKKFTSDVGYSGDSNNSFDTSYGFHSGPWYGFSPPPGLVSATINTLNKGTIREATINLVCHNILQFEAINVLFLKLKYSLLLEWGHTLYFDDKSKLRYFTPNLSDAFLYDNLSSSEILEKIESKRKESNGNYDAFFGVVKNFNWELLENGSYNVTIIAISQGSLIESLKANTNLTPNTIAPSSDSTNENLYKKSTLHYILGQIIKKLDDTSPIDGFKASPDSNALDTDTISSFTNIKPGFKNSGDNGAVNTDNGILTYREGIKINFPSLQINTQNNQSQPQYYIKLGTLLRIIEAFILHYDTSKTRNGSYPPIFYLDHDFYETECLTIPRHLSVDPLTCIIPFDFENPSETNSGQTGIYYTYTQTDKVYAVIYTRDIDGEIIYANTHPQSTTSEDLPEPDLPPNVEFDQEIITAANTQNSSDGQNLIGKQLFEGLEIYKSIFSAISSVPGASDTETVGIQTRTYTRVTKTSVSNDTQTGVLENIDNSFRTGRSTPTIGNTLHMYVNINKIIEVIDNNIDDDGNISVHTLLTQLLSDIKYALGSINKFELNYDSTTNKFSIIDSALIPIKYQSLSSNNVAKFNVNLLKNSKIGGGSFVTNFSLKSEVFAKVANAIAIGAQNNGNAMIANSTPLSNFNSGLTDRIITEKQNPNTSGSKSDQGFDQFGEAYIAYEEFKNKLVAREEGISTSDIELHRSFLTDLFNYDVGTYTSTNNISGTGFIPLNLQLTMDGLSGIKQYQLFTIDEQQLPSEYQDKLNFITTTISHKIDSKGWETTINSLSMPKKSNKDTVTTIVQAPAPKIKKSSTTQSNSKNVSPVEIDTSNISSNIRKAIVEEAKKYFDLPSIGKSPAFIGFTPELFEADLRGVGWYSDGGKSITHWCNWFTLLCWRNAYTNLAKNDPAIANINSTYFDGWKIKNNINATITANPKNTYNNMAGYGYAEELVIGQTIFYPGDMVIYANSESLGGKNHIGICIDFDPTTRKIKTIGGNESNQVRFRDWFPVDEYVKGWKNRVSAVVRVITP